MSATLTIARGMPLLEMTSGERRLLSFLNEHQFNGRFVAFQSPDLSKALALQMDWNPSSIRNVLVSLRRRDWIATGIEDGKSAVWRTKVLLEECEHALHRRKVRSAAGLDFVTACPDADWDTLWREAVEFAKAANEMGLDPSPREIAKAVRRLARNRLG